MRHILFALCLVLGLAGSAQAQTLGLGWAGLGAGFRYWVPESPWGLQAGGLIFTASDSWGDGGIENGGTSRSEWISWGANVLYRFNEPAARPNVYLNVNVGGRRFHEASKNCFSRPGPALEVRCDTEESTRSTLGAMLLGGLEFVFFERFALAGEVGIRFEQTTELETGSTSLNLRPGFGIALLFYAF